MVKLYCRNKETLMKILKESEAMMKSLGIENPTIVDFQELVDEMRTDYISQRIRSDANSQCVMVNLV